MEAQQNASKPFANFRESNLSYNGVEATPTNVSELRIGWFGATNGDSDGGAWWAANRAIEDENAQHTNLPARLIPWWTADLWRSGVSLLARKVYEDAPLALISPVDSASTHLAEQVTAKSGLVLISPASTDKTAALAGVSWMFSCAPSDDAIARSLVAAMLDDLKQTEKLVVLSGTDHSSRMTAREVLREFKRLRRMPDFHFEFSEAENDFAGQFAALRAANANVAAIITSAEQASRLLPKIREAAPGARIFGGPALGGARFRRLVGATNTMDIRAPQLCCIQPNNAGAKRFSKMYSLEFGAEPGYEAILTYDAVRLLMASIRRSGPTRAGIRDALSEIAPWAGIGGSIEFNGTGQNSRTNVPIVNLKVQ